MSDYLIQVAQNKAAQKLVKNLGINLPQRLNRQTEPYYEAFLGAKSVAIGGDGCLHLLWGETLTRAGAFLSILTDSERVIASYANLNQIKIFGSKKLVKPTKALIFDATNFESIDDLKSLYSFFHENIRLLEANGRIVIVGIDDTHVRGSDQAGEQAAICQGLQGFMRSLAKEIGRKGATANLILCSDKETALARSQAPLLYLLSPRSAYISGQSLVITGDGPDTTPVSWHKPLSGKTALVTGAARGIGAATAAALAREGASVICLDRPEDEKPLAETALAINAKVLLQDISSPDAPPKIQEFLKEQTPGIDILVHNAGITRDKTLANMDETLWNSVLDVNLRAVMAINKSLLISGINPFGRIICLSSIAGIAGNFGQCNYATAKSALIGVVSNLAPSLRARGITINAVAPGFIETRLTADIPFLTREIARRACNLSQGGLPEDVAEAILFLSTPQSQGVSGQVLRVCGGSMIGR